MRFSAVLFCCVLAAAACTSRGNPFIGSWQDDARTTGYVFRANGTVTLITSNETTPATYEVRSGQTAVLHGPMGGMDVLTIGSDGLLHENQLDGKSIALHRVDRVVLGNR